MDEIPKDPAIAPPPPRTDPIGNYEGHFEMHTSRFETTSVRDDMRGRMESFIATLYLVLEMPEGGGPGLVHIAEARSPFSELAAAQNLIDALRQQTGTGMTFLGHR